MERCLHLTKPGENYSITWGARVKTLFYIKERVKTLFYIKERVKTLLLSQGPGDYLYEATILLLRQSYIYLHEETNCCLVNGVIIIYISNLLVKR